MLPLLRTLVVGFIVLGVLIFVHELGHFLMAKWCGIRVLTFSLGFGRRLVGVTRGDTEYRISAVPFGGYVRMAGENPEEEGTGEADEFPSRPVWQRILVALSGPVANLLFAFVLLWAAFMIGVQQPEYLDSPVIGSVEKGSSAAEAELAPGDTVVSIDGTAVESWKEIEQMMLRGKPAYEVTVKRGSKTLTRYVSTGGTDESGVPRQVTGGILPAPPAVAGSVKPNWPADSAGFRPSDTVLAIDSTRIHSWLQLSQIVEHWDSTSGPLSFVVKRDQGTDTLGAYPRFDKEQDRYLIGIGMAQPPTRLVKYNVSGAAVMAWNKCGEYAAMIFVILKKLVFREVSARQLQGPIGIVQMSGAMASAGLVAILNFMALIGVNLAVLNLLPLVITDGGMIVFLIIEAIRGKPLSARAHSIINRIFIFLFIALFLYVSINDIKRAPDLFRTLSK